jgi:UTP:GlnB (protein PII) uridylyltransferase
MVPRGEVGLIFAALGLRQGILGQEIYASLLLVVLVTTLVTPPALRWRLLSLGDRSRGKAGDGAGRSHPPWLAVWKIGSRSDTTQVELLAEPPAEAALEVAFEAARLADEHRPGSKLLDWIDNLPERGLTWSRGAADRFFDVLRHGGPRAWRFLGITGVLDRALPELGTAMTRRQADASELDPLDVLRWPRLHHLVERAGLERLRHPEHALLAAVVLDAAEGERDAPAIARRMVQRMRLGPEAEHAVGALVADAGLLDAAARRVDTFDEETVLQLAIHLGSPEQARALYLLTLAEQDDQPWDFPLVTELHDLIQQALTHPELTGSDAVNMAEHRRGLALGMVSDPAVRDRVEATPRSYLLVVSPDDLARQAALCEPPIARDEVRVDLVPLGTDEYRVDFVAHDRVGLFAREALVLANTGADVPEALAATWGDGTALASFRIITRVPPDPRVLHDASLDVLEQRLLTAPHESAEIEFDHVSSPWHTVCRVTAPDRHRLLYGITAAFSEAGANVHSARVATLDGEAVDVFTLTDKNGHKLNDTIERAVVKAIHEGLPAPRSSRRSRRASRREPAAQD